MLIIWNYSSLYGGINCRHRSVIMQEAQYTVGWVYSLDASWRLTAVPTIELLPTHLLALKVCSKFWSYSFMGNSIRAVDVRLR